jgi:hypothetical protein
MSKKRKSWFCYPRENKRKLLALCSVNSQRTCSPSVFAGLLPPKILDKAESVFVMTSGTSNGDIYMMANVNRIDRDNDQVLIDQEPFGFFIPASDDCTSLPSGCCIHHGAWEGRTTLAPGWISGSYTSGELDVYPPIPFENLVRTLDDPILRSQHKAFQKILSVLTQ